MGTFLRAIRPPEHPWVLPGVWRHSLTRSFLSPNPRGLTQTLEKRGAVWGADVFELRGQREGSRAGGALTGEGSGRAAPRVLRNR